MKLRDFELECYFGKYEFTAPYLLAQSDCESVTVRELLAMEEGSREAYLDCWLGYTETWGAPELRDAVAGLYSGASREDVLMLCGAQEGILAYMNVMLDAGDHAVIMRPNYPSAWEAVRAIPGCEWSEWHVRDEGGVWAVDFDELAALIRPNTKLVAVNSPNNPTGFAFSDEQLGRLCGFCRERGLYLFCDEVYKGLEPDGLPRRSAAELYEKAASLGVMSKAYGLAGLRVGWLASRDRETLEKVVKFKHYTSICNAAPSEFLSLIALKHGPELLERNRSIIRENRKTAAAFFARHPGLFSPRPIDGGSVAFHRFTGDMGIDEFCARAVEEKGVLLLPGRVYGVTEPYFRMGYGRKSFAGNLAKLEEFVEGL